MTLLSRADTLSVLKFCISNLLPVFPMEKYYLYIGNNWREINPDEHSFHADSRLSPTFSLEETTSLLRFKSSLFKGSCLTSTTSSLAPYLVELQCFETLHAKSNISWISYD